MLLFFLLFFTRIFSFTIRIFRYQGYLIGEKFIHYPQPEKKSYDSEGKESFYFSIGEDGDPEKKILLPFSLNPLPSSLSFPNLIP